MTLIEHYLFAVGGYLGENRADKRDILAELAEHLQSRMDERTEELGRALTEAEQKEVLGAHGEPFAVASRYGGTGPGFAFGPLQVISPQGFPGYVGLLAVVFTATTVATTVAAIVEGISLFELLRRLVGVLAVEFVALTAISVGLDRFLFRRGKDTPPADRLDPYLFWSPYAQQIPRWYSVAGLVTLALASLWWATVPWLPSLTLGDAARVLEPSAALLRFYWPLTALLALGMAQRVANLVRPDRLWLLPAIRLVVNVTAVALFFALLDIGSFVAVRADVPATADTAALAASTDMTVRGLLRGAGTYWAFNTLWILWVGIQHARHLMNRRRRPLPSRKENNR